PWLHLDGAQVAHVERRNDLEAFGLHPAGIWRLFSVANFFARSSEARASLAMRYAPSRSSLNRGGAASIRPAGALPLHRRRSVRRDGDAFLRLHANVDRVTGRRPQRRMRPRLQHNIAHLDVEIQILAEEILGVDGGADDVLTGCALRLLLGQLDILGT